MSRILFIDDFFIEHIIGGGELNNHELILLLQENGWVVTKIQSHMVNEKHLDSADAIIISNFVNLHPQIKNKITNSATPYVIYEHDHKYLRNRNPAVFTGYKAPESMVINKEFYKKAKAVFCQSSFHESIIKKNLNLDNLYNVSGNLWSTQSLETMRILSKKQKDDCYSVMNSLIEHKNTREASFYCEKKEYKYSLIASNNYQEFLSLLSNNDKFIFLPKTPETLSRVVVEARMMNIKVITNKRVGASYENWFNLKGEKLINYMLKKRTETTDKIIEVING